MTILILAAGSARRMGRQKLLLPVDGRPMIERVIDAAQAWSCVVVAGGEVAATLDSRRVRIVTNDSPERGMSHSLTLGNAAIDVSEPIAIVLGDLADLTPTAIATAIAAYDDTVDVVVPQFDGRPAHPVIFGPRARRKIAELPAGDTIRQLRDDAHLRQRVVPTERSASFDIDTPAQYVARARSLPAKSESSP